MTKREIEILISMLEDQIADLENQIAELKEMDVEEENDE